MVRRLLLTLAIVLGICGGGFLLAGFVSLLEMVSWAAPAAVVVVIVVGSYLIAWDMTE